MDDSTSEQINLRTGSSNSNEFFGWETYTEDIFTLAREHTNPNVKLFYNDYNAEANWGKYNDKTGAVYNYIKSMKEKGIPIDGVGFQMHVSCDNAPNYDQLTKLIDMYEEIGVETHITEIDVTMARCDSVEGQNEVYMNVFRACFDNPNCTVFTVWGAYDKESWIGAENTPLIFDADMYPKDVYFEMLDYVLSQLPDNASYPVPTVTTRPTPAATSTDTSATYIIKPDTFMIEPSWNNWSWSTDTVEFDNEGNAYIDFIEGEYGAFSLHYSGIFNAGTFHFEMKSSIANAPVNFVVHTIKGSEFVTLKTFDKVLSGEMESFDISVPNVEGGYNRVSLQNASGIDFTISVNNFYFIPSESENASSSSDIVYIINPENYMIEPGWSNWSWDTDSVSIDDNGNIVVDFIEEKYGGFSVHTSKIFNASTFHFEMMSSVANAPFNFIVSKADGGEFITIDSFENVSNEEMQAFDVKVPAISGGYNRVSIQNIGALDVTITVNNFYYVENEEEEEEEDLEDPSTIFETIFESSTFYEHIDEPTIVNEPVVEPTTIIEPIDEPIVEPTSNIQPTIEPTTTIEPIDEPVVEPTGNVEQGNDTTINEEPTTEDNNNDNQNTEPTNTENNNEDCWAKALGYNCCTYTTKAIYKDKNGSWGVENKKWCGIIVKKESNEDCWSTQLGYPCCKKNGLVYAVDSNGSWGYENFHWCGLEKADESCKFSALGYLCCPNEKVIYKDKHKWGFSKGRWCGVEF